MWKEGAEFGYNKAKEDQDNNLALEKKKDELMKLFKEELDKAKMVH